MPLLSPVDKSHGAANLAAYLVQIAYMSVAKIVEITSSSKVSFEDAIVKGIARASKTIKNIKGAWVQDQKVDVEKNKVIAYRVTLKLTFVLE